MNQVQIGAWYLSHRIIIIQLFQLILLESIIFIQIQTIIAASFASFSTERSTYNYTFSCNIFRIFRCIFDSYLHMQCQIFKNIPWLYFADIKNEECWRQNIIKIMDSILWTTLKSFDWQIDLIGLLLLWNTLSIKIR